MCPNFPGFFRIYLQYDLIYSFTAVMAWPRKMGIKVAYVVYMTNGDGLGNYRQI